MGNTKPRRSLDEEFVRIFVTQSDKNLKILEGCCISGDNKQWCETAHMLKGGAGMRVPLPYYVGARRQRLFIEAGQLR